MGRSFVHWWESCFCRVVDHSCCLGWVKLYGGSGVGAAARGWQSLLSVCQFVPPAGGAVMAGNCMQLLSSGVREDVLFHPVECLSCCISECHICILPDVPLDGPFQKNRIQTTCKGVLQHDFGEGAHLDCIGFHPEEVKVESVLPHRLCEPLLVSEERPSKGGGIAMLTQVLF